MNFKLVVFFVLIISLSRACSAQGWKVVAQKKGILIEKSSKTKNDTYHFRATAKVKASLVELEKLVENIPNYSNWLYKYELAEVLEASGNIHVFRAKILAPFPLKNRKLQIKLIKNKTEDFVSYQMQGIQVADEQFCIACEEVVGISGSWELKKITDQLTEVRNTTKVIVDLPLPKSLLYPLFYRAPQKSFENLLKMYP
ncbi:SRPBCC family protein [Aquimarina agarilytica]|uniref:hypothetical protein n=1 Tax=Aquimarina agarilytica TaxID=1087449 RepID=UPI000288B106|nr:hypothetical protein [Aquimarina agarilytica]